MFASEQLSRNEQGQGTMSAHINGNGNGKPRRLTGKQASFVDKYLGEARFNASLAAKLAGYKATSRESFEVIGSENLTKPLIRKAIDDYFRMSRMTSDEVLNELSELARGSSKDKIRALALLSSHFGILDGAGRDVGEMAQRGKIVRVPPKVSEEGWSEITNEQRAGRIAAILDAARTRRLQTAGAWPEQATQFNEAAEANNKRVEQAWADLLERYKDSREAVAALTELRGVVHQDCINDPCMACKTEESSKEPIEPEIIPPERRLRPAAVERLMRDVTEEPREQPRCPEPASTRTTTIPPAPEESASVAQGERIRPYGYCLPIDGEEVERIKERDRDRFRIPMIY